MRGEKIISISQSAVQMKNAGLYSEAKIVTLNFVNTSK